MGDYLPKFKPGQAFTVVAGAGGVTGGQLITFAGLPAAANATDWAGVASHDAAAGHDVGVYSDAVQYLVADAAIAKGAPAKSSGAGHITAHAFGVDGAERLVGFALVAAVNAGDVIPVKLVR